MIKFSYTAHFRSNIYSLINESTRKYKSRALVPRTIVFPFHTGTLLDFSYLMKDNKNIKLGLITLTLNLNWKFFFIIPRNRQWKNYSFCTSKSCWHTYRRFKCSYYLRWAVLCGLDWLGTQRSSKNNWYWFKVPDDDIYLYVQSRALIFT